MDVWQYLLLVLAGLFGGVLAGLFGVGGGIVFVPALVYGAGWNVGEAVAASLVITLSVGVVAAAGYVTVGFDRLSGLPPLILGSMIGAWPGVRLRERLPETVLQRAFAAYMVVVAVLIVVDVANGA